MKLKGIKLMLIFIISVFVSSGCFANPPTDYSTLGIEMCEDIVVADDAQIAQEVQNIEANEATICIYESEVLTTFSTLRINTSEMVMIPIAKRTDNKLTTTVVPAIETNSRQGDNYSKVWDTVWTRYLVN